MLAATSSAKVFAETERFWSLTNRSRVPLADEFDLQLDLQTPRDAARNSPPPPSDATTAAASISPSSSSSPTPVATAEPQAVTASSQAEPDASPLEPKKCSYKFHLHRVTSRSQPLVQSASTRENDLNGELSADVAIFDGLLIVHFMRLCFIRADDHSDEPLLSGSGVIDGNMEDSQLLDRWRELLASWRLQSAPQRPPQQLRALVVGGGREGPRGVPESVRGQVWPLLASSLPASSLLVDPLLLQQRRTSGSPLTCSPAREPRPDAAVSNASASPSDARPGPMSGSLSSSFSYSELSARECSNESDLQKDLARTFPQHEFFRQPEAAGQAALHRLCRVRINTLLVYCTVMFRCECNDTHCKECPLKFSLM